MEYGSLFILLCRSTFFCLFGILMISSTLFDTHHSILQVATWMLFGLRHGHEGICCSAKSYVVMPSLFIVYYMYGTICCGTICYGTLFWDYMLWNFVLGLYAMELCSLLLIFAMELCCPVVVLGLYAITILCTKLFNL